MKVIILGSGIIGITTAYVLASRGHEVHILERKDCCAGDTSFANGGQLSYSHAEPWGNPSVLPKLPKWIFREDSPLVVRPRLDMAMMRWGLGFLRNCTTARARINCVNMLRLGLYSRDKMAVIRDETGIAFDFSDKGILHIFSTQSDFDHAVKQAEFQAKFGGEEKVLTREECLEMEPALSATARPIVGGIHAYQDESGDAFVFCQELLKYCQEHLSVSIHYDAEITDIRTQGENIAAIETSAGEFIGDAYVMALGSYSAVHLKKLGIRVPIYPMKGYSLTIPADDHCPNISITDGSVKVVYSRLGNRLRVAGTAEFAGYDHAVTQSRIEPILAACRTLFPAAAWDSPERTEWACLRPSTPDGPPILGRTPLKNFLLNTGHGTLGWTQGAGSAYIVADILENRMPAIMMSGLTLARA